MTLCFIPHELQIDNFGCRETFKNKITRGTGLFSRPKQFINFQDDAPQFFDPNIKKAMQSVDRLKEGSAVTALEEKVADLLGKNAGLFVPTETMANLIAVMSWCTQRGSEFICGNKSHLYRNELAGLVHFSGATPRPVQNFEDGRVDLEEVTNYVKHFSSRNFAAASPVLLLENCHEGCGGSVLSQEYMCDVERLATEHDLCVHLDGTRLLHAQTALGLSSPARLCQGAESVTMSVCRGLGLPAGAVLAGSEDFIARARRLRQGLGGNMHLGAEILAAAALETLDKAVLRLQEDHDNAGVLALGLHQIPGLLVDVSAVQTNVITARIAHPNSINTNEVVADLKKNAILVSQLEQDCIRLMTHSQISVPDIQYTLKIFNEIFLEYSKQPLISETGEVKRVFDAQVGASFSTLASPLNELDLTKNALASQTTPNLTSSRQYITNSSCDPLKSGPTLEPNLSEELAFSNHIQAALDDGIAEAEITGNYSASILQDGDSDAGGNQTSVNTIITQDYEELLFSGASVSPKGFTVLLTTANKTRALGIVVSTSDPMSKGLDVRDPESPEAMTILQLMQGIDVASYLPDGFLHTVIGSNQNNPLSLELVAIEELTETKFKARLVASIDWPELETSKEHALHDNATFSDNLIKDTFLEAETGSKFQAIALALRHGAQIYIKNQCLLPPVDLSFDANEIYNKFPEIVEANRASTSKFGTDKFDPEAETDLLRKKLKDAIQAGEIDKVRLIRRQLKVYDTATQEE